MNARTDTQSAQKMDADTARWLDRLDDIGEDRGYFQPMGPNHSAIFTDESPTLLVTFETIDSIRKNTKDELPLGFEMVKDNDWSQLCVLAHGDNWFRDPYVYAYFDRMVDDGFFEDFDQVVFYGSGMCGYAAAAFSVAAPGATVIAIQPQATLDPQVADWDNRFLPMRRTCFTDRYGYAPEMIEAASSAFILYDPAVTVDAMHAALFTMRHVTKLRCRYLGSQIETELREMDVLQSLIEAAGSGTLTKKEFDRLYRARRSHMPYIRHLLRALDRRDRTMLALALLENLEKRIPTHRFRRRLRAMRRKQAAET